MNTKAKTQFVLVHGAWHGAWCWEKVIPLIEAKGHGVHTLDLPGLGSDETPLEDVSLNAYVDAVVKLISDIEEKVVLLGHSMGGIVITQVAEKIPEQISTLIYLTAFSPVTVRPYCSMHSKMKMLLWASTDRCLKKKVI